MEQISSHTHKYQIGKVLGNGSFGTVSEATTLTTGEVVAIKKVLQDPRYKNRELSIMKQMFHPNVVSLKDYFYTESSGGSSDSTQRYLSLVMQYMPQNLYRTVKNSSEHSKHPGLQWPYAQIYAYQIIRSLGYMHSLGICHRDLKPQNVLIDPRTHVAKLCDFGSAKRLHAGENSVSYICSRFYRAPELMLGSTNYSCAIDTWSMGCVLAEMLTGKPLFAGSTSVDQLVRIVKLLGSPNAEQLEKMNQNYKTFKFPTCEPRSLREHLPSEQTVPQSAIDLLEKMFKFVPEERIDPYDALAHPMFDDLRKEGYTLPDGSLLPQIFNFSEHEISQMIPATHRTLIPSWVTFASSKAIN